MLHILDSYGTCSHENTFTDSADDDHACNTDHSEIADWCTPPVNSVAAQLTLNIDMPADATALATFKSTFQTDIAATLTGVDADNVIITSVTAGSVIVDFYIAPAADGTALVVADDVTTALAAGVTIAGDTLTSDSITTAPAVTAPVPDVDCAGSWSACTADCEVAASRSWTTTAAQSGAGAACPVAADAADCVAGDGGCPARTPAPATTSGVKATSLVAGLAITAGSLVIV